MQRCRHCRQFFKDEELISDELGNKFCCNGCKQVFYLLSSKGLDEFYNKLGKNNLDRANIDEVGKNEIASIYRNFVRKNSDGFSEVFIIIDGIHCSACVWLNEKILFSAKGVLEAQINAQTKKAKIVWDESQTDLATIFQLITQIGYRPYAYDPTRAQESIDKTRRAFYAKLLVGIFATMNIMWIAIALYSGYFSGMDENIKDIFHFAEFILATPVLFFTGSVFFKGAKTAIKNRYVNMDLLISAGASLTYIYSVYAMFSRSAEVYFDSVVMIVTFVFIGKFLEVVSQKNSVDTLDSLSKLVISDIWVKQGEKFSSKNIYEVTKDDLILARSGDKIQIDGIVESGEGSFDYASLTGESLPLFKKRGDELLSGAVCLDGRVEYRALSDFKSSTLSKMINLLENASLKRPLIQNIANKISGYFSITILSLGFLSFLFWYLSGATFEKSLMIFISIIVIACPCALGLATPVASLVGLATGLKKGVIFKEAKVLEEVAKCNSIVFDKTGTLTKSNLKIVNSKKYFDFDENIMANLLKGSIHPISRAIFKEYKESFKAIELRNYENIEARGVSATYNGIALNGGSATYMRELGIKCDDSDMTNYYFSIGGKVAMKFELEDELRDGAKESIDRLSKLGFKIYLLSGDNFNVVEKIAKELHIKNFYANQLPTQKAEFIGELIKNRDRVIMVGDGINDAIALSSANVGICLGSGASISLEKSDIIVLNDSLATLTSAIKLSKQTYRTIKQNLAFSLFYNSVTVPLAIMGYVIPLVAAISMSLSSLVVVLNSLRIKLIKD